MKGSLLLLPLMLSLCSCATAPPHENAVLATSLSLISFDEKDILGDWGTPNDGMKARIVGFYSLLTRNEYCVIEFKNISAEDKRLLLDAQIFSSNRAVIQSYDNFEKACYYKSSFFLPFGERYESVTLKAKQSTYLIFKDTSFYIGQTESESTRQYRYNVNEDCLKSRLKEYFQEKKGELCLGPIETASVRVDVNAIKRPNSDLGPSCFSFEKWAYMPGLLPAP